MKSLENISQPSTISILGSKVSQVNMLTALEHIELLIASPSTHYVCVPDVYQIVYAHDNPSHRAILNNASMVTPDGTPLVWLSRWRGTSKISRVAGPDLLPALCKMSMHREWKHYFYGGAEGTAENLSSRLSKKYPGLRVAGYESPPFRQLSVEEDADVVRRLNACGADIIWIGLGCPKQEIWMAEHASRIHNAVLIGVGAAFDFHAEKVKRAPVWMQRSGLEWLYRLVSEPRRLWRRYLISAPRFVALVFKESISSRMEKWKKSGQQQS